MNEYYNTTLTLVNSYAKAECKKLLWLEERKSKGFLMELTNREASFIKYLQAKMIKENRDYVNTNYYYVQNIARYKNVQGARYLIKSLVKKKLLSVREGTNYKGRQYIRIEFARPRVLKKLMEGYEFQKSTEMKEMALQKWSVKDSEREELSINNNIIINQVNHNDEKARKNTTVQEMLSVANEELGSKITLSKKVARYMYAAFKQKFKSLERWREYIRFKKRGKVYDSLRYLMFLLSFATINSAIGDMEMVESFTTRTREEVEAYKEAAFNHVDTLREGERCKEVRKKIIERKGAEFYFTWFKRVKLIERGGGVEAESDEVLDPRHFVRDYVNEQFRYDLERCYLETRDERF